MKFAQVSELARHPLSTPHKSAARSPCDSRIQADSGAQSDPPATRAARKQSAAEGPDVALSAAWRSTPQPWKPGGLAIAQVRFILAVCVISANRHRSSPYRPDISVRIRALVSKSSPSTIKLSTAAKVRVRRSQQPRLAAALAAGITESGPTAASTYPTSQPASEEGVMDRGNAREDFVKTGT